MPPTATKLRRISAIDELRAAISQARGDGARIGFVATMGATPPSAVTVSSPMIPRSFPP